MIDDDFNYAGFYDTKSHLQNPNYYGNGVTLSPSSSTNPNAPSLIDTEDANGNVAFPAINDSGFETGTPGFEYTPPSLPSMPGSQQQPSIIGAFFRGMGAGAAEVTYKLSLPVAWVSWRTEFKTLRDIRDQAWIDSGLNGTKTQYATQFFANVGVTSLYASMLCGPFTRALGDKMLSTKQWTYMTSTHKGFETMSAAEKYLLIVEKYGTRSTLTPSWRGLALGLTTKMPLKSHLCSIETIAIGIVAAPATFNRLRVNIPDSIGESLGKPIGEWLYSSSAPPSVKIEKEP